MSGSSEPSGAGVGQLLETIPWASSGRFSGSRWDLLVYERGLLALRNTKPMGSKWSAWLSDRARDRWIKGQEERMERLAQMPPERLLTIHPDNALLTYDQIAEGRLYASAVDTRLVLRLADGRELTYFWAHGDSLLGEISPSESFDVVEVAFEQFLGDKLVASRESLLGQDSGAAAAAQVAPLARQAAAPVQAAPAQQPSSWPAAWYPDPTGQARLRYWDGSAWTAHTAT